MFKPGAFQPLTMNTYTYVYDNLFHMYHAYKCFICIRSIHQAADHVWYSHLYGPDEDLDAKPTLYEAKVELEYWHGRRK